MAAGGLPELDPAVADLGLRLEQRILHGRKRQLAPPELDPGDADMAAAGVAVERRLAVVELDPCTQLVRLAEGVRLAKSLEVFELVRRRLVVVGDAHLERELRHARDRLGRNPGDRRDGLLDSHGRTPLWLRMSLQAKAKPAGLPPSIPEPEPGQSVAERRPRRNANAPATAAITTAISDLFGLPPSTDGVTSRAFFLPARFATFQTAQPMTAFRLLITLTRIAYPHRPRPNQRKKKSGAGGRARPRNGTRAHPASLEAVRAENLQRVRNGDQSHSPKRRPLLSLEAGEAY